MGHKKHKGKKINDQNVDEIKKRRIFGEINQSIDVKH